MSDNSHIEWTEATWNPVTGCTKVSPGCDNCYMYAMYPRLKGMKVPGYEHAPDVVRLQPGRLMLPLTWTKPRKVFVNSMSDAFHRDIPDAFLLEMFLVMKESADKWGHVFQVLTKRPGRAVAWWAKHREHFPAGWPESIWLGTSIENQKYAPRLTVLARVPAPVRFASVEPLLGHVDLSPWLASRVVSWVIVGGESGPGARELDVEWVRSLRRQCDAAGVSLFVKQLGSAWATAVGALAKGGEPADWPPDLRVRTFPTDPVATGQRMRRSNGVQRRAAGALSGSGAH